ncbi:MAG: hypothetical protein VB126_13360 [Paludibacter sp.]|nr:hypothetical protein [Paludibacter sp.]
MKTNLNRIVTAIMLFVAFLLFSGYISAQDTKPQAEERAKNLTEQMQKKLSLTDTQYQSVYTINLKYAKMNEQLKSSTESKMAKFKKFKSLQQNKSKELQTVLTKDQFTQYEEWIKDVKAELKENYRNREK